MTKSVGVHEAKTHLSRLLDEAASGEEIVITSNGTPVARLVAAGEEPVRAFGKDQGVFEVPADFDEPLPDEIVSAFEG